MAIKLSFDFRTMRLNLEGEGKDLISVLEAVKVAAPSFDEIRLFGLGKMPDESDAPAFVPNAGGAAAPGVGGLKPVGVREFTKTLSLDSQFIKIAAVAFYHREFAQKATFTAKEMGDWFGLCGFQKPKQMSVALSDTLRRRAFIENKGRDQWALSTTGENAVRKLMGQ